MGAERSTLRRTASGTQTTVIKPEGKKPLDKPRYAWINTIKSDIKDVRYDSMV
jgi:hypothetical protein